MEANRNIPGELCGWIATARDHLTIKWSPGEVWETVKDFAALPEEEAREKYHLGEDVQDWKVALAQRDIRNTGPDRKQVVPVLYRPFDVRFTYYTGQSRGFLCRPRSEVMRHLLSGENIALKTSRFLRQRGTVPHVARKRRGSAIDGRTTRHATSAVSLARCDSGGALWPHHALPVLGVGLHGSLSGHHLI